MRCSTREVKILGTWETIWRATQGGEKKKNLGSAKGGQSMKVVSLKVQTVRGDYGTEN